jgi:tripartite-type tricarboxylate transporter receptor subunit TctC
MRTSASEFFIVIAAVLLSCGPATPAAAGQAYPERPIKILVGGAPGSVPDAMIRPIADQLSIRLGRPVVVENKPGAGGIVAMGELARSPADGYTLAVATMSQAVFNSFLFSKLPYEPQRDLEPITTLVTGAMVLAANPSFPANSLAELAKIAHRGGPRPFVAMPQTGSPPHVVALLLQREVGMDLNMVPYKAGAEAVAAAVAGNVPLVIEAPTSIAPQVRAGKLKALVVTGRQREPGLPDTPTLSESGFAGIEGEAWIGLVAPAGTPPTVIARVHRELSTILAKPEVREQMATLGFRTLATTPESFARLIADERVKWGAIIRSANLKVD